MDVIGGSLFFWILLIAFAMMIGGPKSARKIVALPFKFMSGIVVDFVHGVLRIGFDLFGSGLRFGGHQINRGVRHVLRLPPPRRRPQRHRRRGEHYDDGRD